MGTPRHRLDISISQHAMIIIAEGACIPSVSARDMYAKRYPADLVRNISIPYLCVCPLTRPRRVAKGPGVTPSPPFPTMDICHHRASLFLSFSVYRHFSFLSRRRFCIFRCFLLFSFFSCFCSFALSINIIASMTASVHAIMSHEYNWDWKIGICFVDLERKSGGHEVDEKRSRRGSNKHLSRRYEINSFEMSASFFSRKFSHSQLTHFISFHFMEIHAFWWMREAVSQTL